MRARHACGKSQSQDGQEKATLGAVTNRSVKQGPGARFRPRLQACTRQVGQEALFVGITHPPSRRAPRPRQRGSVGPRHAPPTGRAAALGAGAVRRAGAGRRAEPDALPIAEQPGGGKRGRPGRVDPPTRTAAGGAAAGITFLHCLQKSHSHNTILLPL